MQAWTKLIHQHSRNNLLVHTLDRRYQARLHDQVVVKGALSNTLQYHGYRIHVCLHVNLMNELRMK